MSEKGGRIRQTLKDTRERRSALKCSVFRLTIDASRLSKEKKDYLQRLFLEKKWFRNAVIASQEIYAEEREIKVLSSQMRQSVIEKVHGNIKALSALKKQRKNGGRLKFLSRCNTVELKQSGVTYRIIGNRLFVQGFQKQFRIEGVE